ncbi:MAG: Rieske (2Fe-2S) protein [Planctomycetaceae bacterium]
MTHSNGRWTRALNVAELDDGGCRVVHLAGRTLAIIREGERVHAVDNRCPHMGFPLAQGSVHDGILTCHWHHARFDLCTGGTFDQWADDVDAFPTEIRDGAVWVDLAPHSDAAAHRRERLRIGLERNIPLVIAKAVLGLTDEAADGLEPFRAGLEFGVRHRRRGWGMGLTIHSCLRNLSPHLDPDDRPLALFHGLAAVARDCDGEPPRHALPPLPGPVPEFATLARWFRRFVEVRDAEGAERCLISAIRGRSDPRRVAEMLFAAVTDHRYIDIGHPLDFTNKALDALDAVGWEHAESVLASLVAGYASAERMEESNAWRHPIDLVRLLEEAFAELPAAIESGRGRSASPRDLDALGPTLLEDDPRAIVAALSDSLRAGHPPVEVAGAVAHAAALRIARFPTSNEFGDWDTALHTFTFANAVQQGLRRVDSWELARGVFDAALSVYLDRFLNVPAVPLPMDSTKRDAANGEDPLKRVTTNVGELSALLDRRHEVDAAAMLVARHSTSGGDSGRLLALLGKLLLREDRDFHTIQAVEAAITQFAQRASSPSAPHFLIAAVRYLAAHAPTMRSQGQTWRIATRLHRGEDLFDEPGVT